MSFADFSLISGPGPASPEDGEDLEARSGARASAWTTGEKNDSKSRLAIPNSFLQDFGHRCIFRLPIFGRGFCRFHFDCERSFQIPTDWYLIFCQCRRCATYSASDMRVPPLVACWTSLYLRVGHFSGLSGWWVELFTVVFRRVQRVYVDQAITTGATATNFFESSIFILQFFSSV